MYKLRRSRFIKFISGFLVIVLTAAIIANIAGTYLMMSENLYYATRHQLLQKVYSYVYEYTASDLMRYLNIAENMYSNNSSYKNYNSSEFELYKSKYDKTNSNIYFEIRDEYNNLLLSNNGNRYESEFVIYSSAYITAHPDSDGWYVNGNEDEVIATERTTLYEKITDIDGNELTTSPWSEAATGEEAVSEEPETVFPDETVTENEISHTPSVYVGELREESHSITNPYSGKTTTLHYYYENEVDSLILQHCKSTLKQLPYDITDFTFYQEDFYVDYADEDYDIYDIKAKYSAVNEAIEQKAFTTTLLSDDKEIEVQYAYNGSFSFSEFESRLKYLTLISKNIAEDRLSFSYVQKGGIQLRVIVEVPYSCYINDAYNFAEELTDIAIVYRNNIFAITVADCILVLFSLIFIFWSAGYIPKTDTPVARGLHAISFDLYLFLSVAAMIGFFAMVNTNDDLFIMLGLIGCGISIISLVYTIPVRIRAKTLRTNNLYYRFYRFVKNAAAIANEEKNSRLTVAIIMCIFAFITLCEIIFFLAFNNNEAAFVVFLARLIEAPVILFALVGLVALHNGARAISKGDITYRIKSNFLFGPLKSHAKYLNSINDTINNAVDERLKSESLKTELITNVSHDLKTPLTSIVNYIDLLKKEKIENPKAIEYIEVIDRQSQRLKKLTIDIVDASKAATGNVEVHYEKTVLNVILLQTNGEYIERLEEKSLVLVPDIPDDEIAVYTDGRLLWRVIDNLMNNICKYSMPGTRVYLTLYEDNGNAYITLRNISREKLNVDPDTLTERFVRGDTSRNTEGSGLGLSIANSLTEIMGGTFSISIDGDLFKVVLSFPMTEL